MTSAEIRKAFLDFFISKQHHIVPSAPIVVKNDPTLMFTNAGMNQFKDYFLGNKPAPYHRIADTQKCLRVSGKHNDLEEVGVDTYHHTMFEMLGNWSFGDYFKKEAIEWSWELLTKVLNIPIDRLYVTVFEGDEKEGLPKDDEASREWQKWIAAERILLGNKKDNFWEMGDTGPCGPCTEIHVDTRSDEERKLLDGSTLVNADHPQVIEIWNNVFIQYNRLKDGSLQPLPAKHVDTGMGFERLVRVIQGKNSNYDTDVFSGTIKKIVEIIATTPAHKAVAYDQLPQDSKQAIAYRVIADHIRAISFTIADGQLPSNTGAGYVIRRILRRAVRYYYSYLDYQQPLLFQLVPIIAHQFENVFPDLSKQQEFVSRVIREEEDAFLRTLEKGLKRIEDIVAGADQSIAGTEAFELYDTYGFPFDLTQLIATERSLQVDEAGFAAEMQKQKQRSRAATAIDSEDWVLLNDGNSNVFVGYDALETEATVLKYRKVKAKGKEAYQLVLNNTPFYAESGGQVGDTGELIFTNETKEETIQVVDTKKENDLIVHIVEALPTDLQVKVFARVNGSKRKSTAIHHSATHLLHAALRQVLGTHVAQKGSLVNADHLRFDFSHFNKMTPEEIAQAELIVNEKIRENIPVVIRYMPKEDAMKTGAMALFGEKYGDEVRVVTIDPDYSVELCGGTHVGATGELGYFKITSESAVAAGVRRIEAISGGAAESYINDLSIRVQQIKEILKYPKDVLKTIADLLNDKQELQKLKTQLENVQAQAAIKNLQSRKETVSAVTFFHDNLPNADMNVLKKVFSALEIKDNKQEKIVAVLTGEKDSKVSVLLGCSQGFTAFDCNNIIKEQIAPLINGGGGGQRFQAAATGTEKGKTDLIVKRVKEAIEKLAR
jgi:alanyl-tRNA synthetase